MAADPGRSVAVVLYVGAESFEAMHAKVGCKSDE
jgi:hypothetical protein